MERPYTPENGPAGFNEIYYAFSSFLIQHGDFKDSWDRIWDDESSLGLPRGADTSFDLRFSKNELQENPHRYHSIHAQFVPSHTDEEEDFNPDTLFAQVEFTEKLSTAFFLSLEDRMVHATVVITDLNSGRRASRKGDQLNEGDVELLRRIFETISANLA